MESKAYCKCKRCGYDKAEVDTSIVLGSYPGQYNYICPMCKEADSIFTGEAYTIATMYVHCLICGKEVITLKTQGEVICDECKEAIKWIKEKMKDDK